MDSENKSKSFGVGGYRGRIIFLGDGTEVLTDSDDTEMFDNADEDKDLASQVSKTSSASNDSQDEATSKGESAAEAKSEPESDETPAAATEQHADDKKETKTESTAEDSKKE